MQATPDNLNSLVEFDSAFIVTSEGIKSAREVYAPTTYFESALTSGVEIESDKWEALTGYTGQHGYNGAVLHASETLSGGLARDILADVGGIYAVTVVEDMDDPEYPAGWCVLKYIG